VEAGAVCDRDGVSEVRSGDSAYQVRVVDGEPAGDHPDVAGHVAGPDGERVRPV